MASIAALTRASASTTSILIFGRKSSVLASAINFRVTFLPPEAFDFGNRHPFNTQAGKRFFTSSSLKGLMMASIFFMVLPVCVGIVAIWLSL